MVQRGGASRLSWQREGVFDDGVALWAGLLIVPFFFFFWWGHPICIMLRDAKLGYARVRVRGA